MKQWYQSKTIWIAILTGFLASANYLTNSVDDPCILNAALIAVAVIHAALRLITTDAINVK